MSTSSGYEVPFASFTMGFEAAQVHSPLGAAVVHELHLLFPAPLSKQHDRGVGFLFQVESQFGANPFRGAVHALPSDALAGDKLHDLHIVKAAIAEPEFIDGADHGGGCDAL